MSYIQSNGHMLGSDDDDFSFSWDDKRAGTKVLLAKDFIESKIDQFQLYKQHSDKYICSLIPGAPNSQARYTPGGLLYKQGENNLQYVTTSSFLLLTYAKYLNANGGHASCGSAMVTSETLVVQAKKQIDYILGITR
ncbi:putative cellulase [Helianthus annuus]|nr:putative cellulase [Helianthus annuus]